ncbi:MFS transporter [Arthrobacter sp. W4I7]|uniref:MFS transporter n=1 Tax=Arthrobacter sp. W4I7 TaxID=3042296 RepID=UPI0027882667|nr:MFS transporter [Arthrobacter sp. W4I7]MDQ0693178.1 MFS family permease [Arthrobacter sp. W4I7]
MSTSVESSAKAVDSKMRKRAVVAAGMGWGLDGFTWTMYGFALTAALPVLHLTTAAAGWVTAVSIVASAVGGVIFGALADRFGRVRVLTWVILGYSLFTALTATSQDGAQFLIWRVLEGLTFGGEWAVGAALVAEYARPENRGRALAFVQSCYAIGWAVSTTAYLVLFSLAPPEVAWRYLFLVGILPALVALYIRKTTRDVVQIPAVKVDNKGKVRALFAAGQVKKTVFATLLGVGVQGIYYSVFVFLPLFLKDERGLTVVGTAGYTWTAIVGSFVGYIASGFLHDALGRRLTFLLFFLGSVASICLFVLTPLAGPEVGLVIIFILGFFASGQAGGTGSYLAELFPTNIRATGQAFAYNVGRGLAAFGPLTVGGMAASIGLGNSILLVGTVGAGLGCIALAMLPETRRKNILEDVTASPVNHPAKEQR